MVGGKLHVDELQSANKQMDTRCHTLELQEKSLLENTRAEWKRLTEFRKQIRVLHEQRAQIEEKIEWNDFHCKQMHQRIQIVEAKIKDNLEDARLDGHATERELSIKQQIEEEFKKQKQMGLKLLKGMRRVEAVEKLVQTTSDRESRYEERKKELMNELRYLVDREDEMKKCIQTKIASIKDLKKEIAEVTPILKEKLLQIECSTKKIIRFTERTKEIEGEIKSFKKDTVRTNLALETAAVDFEVKRRRRASKTPAVN